MSVIQFLLRRYVRVHVFVFCISYITYLICMYSNGLCVFPFCFTCFHVFMLVSFCACGTIARAQPSIRVRVRVCVRVCACSRNV